MENDLEKRIDELSKEINKVFIKDTGYNPKLKEIISPKLPPIQFENLNENNLQNIENTIFNMSGRDKESNTEFSKYLKTMAEIYGYKNRHLLTSFDNIKSRMMLNTEINSLCANIPQVHASLERLAAAIVSSNEAGKSGINLDFFDYDSENDEEDYEKYFRPSMDIRFAMKNVSRIRYDIDLNTKSIIKNCLLYGYQFVSIIPYKEIARDILFKSDRRKEYMTANLSSDFENTILNEIKSKKDLQKALKESFDVMTDMNVNDYKAYKETTDALPDKLDWYLNKVTDNKYRSENAKYGIKQEDMVMGSYAMLDGFMSKTIYNKNDLADLTDYIDNLPDDEFKTFKESLYPAYSMMKEDGIVIDSSLETSGSSNTKINDSSVSSEGYNPYFNINSMYIPSLGTDESIVGALQDLKDKNKRKYDIKGLTGCKIDLVNFNRVVPLFNGDNLMGIFVFDESARNQLINPISTPNRVYNVIRNDALNDRNGLSMNVREDLKRDLFRDMSIVIDRNMDKKLLANNPNLIEDIFNIMEYLDYEQDFSMRFIPKENLQLFKFGEGRLGTSYLLNLRPLLHELVLAKNGNMIDKHFLEKDQYLFSTKFDNSLDMQSRASRATPVLRMFFPRLADMSIPAMANNTVNQYLTHNLPLNSENEKFWDLEKLEGMDLTPKDEYIRNLLDQITGLIYAPESITNPSYNVDYATRFHQTNMTTGEKVIDFQKQLKIPLSQLATKKIQYDTGEEIIRAEVSFDPPFAVNRNVTLENIAQVETQIEINQKYIESKPNLNEAEQNYVMDKVRENMYKDIIDIKFINDTLKKMETSVKLGGEEQ